jgi:hypothetical protein
MGIVHGGDNFSVKIKEKFRFERVWSVRLEEANGTNNRKWQEAEGNSITWASCFVLFPTYDLDERGEASSKHEKEISTEYQIFVNNTEDKIFGYTLLALIGEKW